MKLFRNTQLSAKKFSKPKRRRNYGTTGNKKQKISIVFDENASTCPSSKKKCKVSVLHNEEFSSTVLTSEKQVEGASFLPNDAPVETGVNPLPKKRKKRKRNKLSMNDSNAVNVSESSISDLCDNEVSVDRTDLELSNYTEDNDSISINSLLSTNKKKHRKRTSEAEVSEDDTANITEDVDSPSKKKMKIEVNGNASENEINKESCDSTTKNIKKRRRSKKKKKKKVMEFDKNADSSLISSLKKTPNSKNKSVSFNDNVQVELIESCKSADYSTNEKIMTNNIRKQEKAITYLQKWKNDKPRWKFEKLTQFWLLKNMFQEEMVPNDLFQILLEYSTHLKGVSRNLAVDLSESIIKEMEQKPPDEDNEILEKAYIRARSILQILQ